MAKAISSPDPSILIAPLLPALPAAAISKEPAIGVLPLLAPILRQRVQYLSPTSTEPWLRLLCYDTAKAAKLAEIAQGGGLEPHPVSGEVEIDWDYDAVKRFRRVDRETLQALIVLSELGLAFQLVYVVGDADGGGDGWRVGEVTVAVADHSSALSEFGGAPTLEAAEAQFKTGQAPASTTIKVPEDKKEEEEQDDDGGYWDRYDATPSRTPAKQTPPPGANSKSTQSNGHNADFDDDYYAQYDHIQPAMDNHDPDEEVDMGQVAPPLGLAHASKTKGTEQSEVNETRGSWTLAEPVDDDSDEARRRAQESLVSPRPDSSQSSNGERTVAKLEATADRHEQNEFGVKQHVARSIRSLYILSRSSGIDREEFDRMIRSELDVLAMIEDQV